MTRIRVTFIVLSEEDEAPETIRTRIEKWAYDLQNEDTEKEHTVDIEVTRID